MGDPIRNQNSQTYRPADPSQEAASASSAARTGRPDGTSVTQNETTPAFHHLGQGSWTQRPEGRERKRQRRRKTKGPNSEDRTASGYGSQGSLRAFNATGATQSRSSFSVDDGWKARFTNRDQPATEPSRPRGRIESTGQKSIDPGAMAKFHREFPSMQRLQERFPELSRMDPFKYPTAKDFSEALDWELGEKESVLLKQRHGPAVVQSGLKHLMSQEIEEEFAPARFAEEGLNCFKTEERSPVMTEAKGGTSLPRGMEVGEATARTDPGSDDLATRLALAERDSFASMGIITRHNSNILADRYAQNIERILNRMKSRDQPTWQIFAGKRSMKCTLEGDILKGFLREANFIRFPEFFPASVSTHIFYKQLFPMECSVRLLKNANRFLEVGMSYIVKNTLERYVQCIGKEVSKEFQLSTVLSEMSDLNYLRRPNFEKIFISSFKLLLETGDFHKANEEFLLSARACWPRLPALEDDQGWKGLKRPDDAELVKKARKRVADARAKSARSETAQHSEFGRNAPPEMRRYVENILYYFCLAAADFKEPSFSNPLDWLGNDVDFTEQARTPLWRLYTEFVDLLVTTDLYKINS